MSGGSSGAGASSGGTGNVAGDQGGQAGGGRAGAPGSGGKGGAGGSSGGAAGEAATGGSDGGDGGGEIITNPELIDDMEDRNQYILPYEGRDGLWYTAFGANGSASDAPGTENNPMATVSAEEPNKAPGSTYAVEFKGTGGTEWGAMLALDFLQPDKATKVKKPYDASKYTGLKFWIKAEAAVTIVLRLPLKDTTSEANGACVASDNCEDHFQYLLDLTTEWTEVTLSWEDFSQVGWGYRVGAFDPKQIVSVQFLVPTKKTAHFWLDDISFAP